MNWSPKLRRPVGRRPGGRRYLAMRVGLGIAALAGWFEIARPQPVVGPELSINKGAPNGYAPLDSNQHVPAGNLPTASGSASGICQLGTNSTNCATGSNSPFAMAINVKEYGALGDGVHDDTAAFNLALAAFRLALTTFPTGAELVCPAGQYKITSSLNGTSLQTYPATGNAVINAYGCILDAKFSGTTVLSLMGSTALTVNGLQIYGDDTTGPTTGIQWGRITSLSADRNAFNNVTVSGNFPVAACFNLGSETFTGNHLRCYNSSTNANSHAAVFDGEDNFFGITDPYVTINLPTSQFSMQGNQCLNCDFHSNAGGSTLWLGSVQGFSYIGGYLLNQAGKPLVELYAGGTPVVNTGISFVLGSHGEQTTVPVAVQIDGGTVTSPTIGSFTWSDTVVFETSSIFALANGATSATLNDLRISLPSFSTNFAPDTTVLDTPANYTINGGSIFVQSGQHWVAPPAPQFRGMVSFGGSTPSTYLDVSSGRFAGVRVDGSLFLGKMGNSALGGGNNGNLIEAGTGDFNAWWGGNAGANDNNGSFNAGVGFGIFNSNNNNGNAGVGYQGCKNALGTDLLCLGASTGPGVVNANNVILLGALIDDAGDTSNYMNLGGIAVSTGINAPASSSTTLAGNFTFSSTGAVGLASGTYGQRPTPANGDVRYNSTFGMMEQYANGTWKPFGGVAVLCQNGAPTSVTGTGSLVETNLLACKVPANLLGVNGSVEISALWNYTNSANVKSPIIRFSNTQGCVSNGCGTAFMSSSLTTTSTLETLRTIRNAGATNSQISANAGAAAPGAATTGTPTTGTVDTTQDAWVNVNCAVTALSDTCTLEGGTVKAIVP